MNLSSHIIDCHCHIDKYSDKEIKDICLNDILIIGAATDFFSGERLLKLSQNKNIKIALGIHPEYYDKYHEFDKVKEQIIKNKDNIIAIGEVGIAYFNLLDLDEDEYNKKLKTSINLLEKFVVLSKEVNKPLVLHATQKTSIHAIELLEKYDIKRALFHWFNANEEALKRIIERNYYISVSPDVLYNTDYSNFVSKVPLNNIVLESDGPWEYENGLKSYPKDIENVAMHLSKLFDVSVDDIYQITNKNAVILFNI